MKKILFLFLIMLTSMSYSQDVFRSDSVKFKGKIVIGNDYSTNLYSSSENVLRTDDDFEIIGKLKIRGMQIEISGDTLIIIDEYDSVANRGWVKWLLESGGYGLPSQSGNSGKVLSTNGSVASWVSTLNSLTLGELNLTETTGKIVGAADIGLIPDDNSTVYVGYDRTGVDFTIYEGTTINASIQSTGEIYSASTIDATAYKVNGSVGTSGQAIVSNGTTGGVWATIASIPSQTGNSGKVLSTDGSNPSWVSTLNSITLGQLDLTATTGKITGASTISIEPANSTAVATGYGKTGVDLIHYSNTTPVFSVQETGAGYFASTVDATAYKVNGSIGTSGQAIVSNGTTGGVWATIPALTDGDKGDVVVSSSGTVWTVEAAAGLPSQSGQSGKYLTTNGTTLSWGAGTGGIATAVYDDAQENSFTASDLLKVEDDLGEVNPENARTNLGFSTSVSMTEYGYLANVTSDIQTQINGLAAPAFSAIANGTATSKNFTVGTSSVLGYSGNGVIDASHLGGTAASSYATQSWVNSQGFSYNGHSHSMSEVSGLITALTDLWSAIDCIIDETGIGSAGCH
jgi:hypothetical protein